MRIHEMGKSAQHPVVVQITDKIQIFRGFVFRKSVFYLLFVFGKKVHMKNQSPEDFFLKYFFNRKLCFNASIF